MASRQRSPTPGDMVMRAEHQRKDPARQPLNDAQRALLKRAYDLFDFFDDRLKDSHEEMRKARMMRQLKQDERSYTAPASNTLNSCIDNVIADQVDNLPEAKLVPEREETADSAEEMTDIVSYVLYQAGWQGTYHKLMEDSVVTGTGVAQVFWDDNMENGDGMVSVLAWSPEDFYPDPMYEDWQDGRACFKATHTTIAWVEEHYPDARGYVAADKYSRSETETAFEAPEGDEKVTLIEFWYKRFDAKKRKTHVHMAQVAGGALLYSTELEFGDVKKGEYRDGVFAHGKYPFVAYKYRNVFRSPFGTGLVYDHKDTQIAIDRYIKYIDDNARQSSVQRLFVRKGSGVNPDEVADMSRTIIEYSGSDIRQEMQAVQASPLNSQVYQMMTYLADTMKQDSGQNQFARGEGGLGVTAASAIQSLQEAGGKITRWHTDRYKHAFKEMVEQILWILSDYMEPERTLRIVGGWDSTGNMVDRIVSVVAPRKEGDALPKPAYTVRVQVQKHNPLQIQMDNEFLLQAAQMCAQNGTPLPPEAVIGMLEGYRTKSSILKMVQANSQQQKQMREQAAAIEQLQAQLDQQRQANTQILKGLSTPGGAASMGAVDKENMLDSNVTPA